jgi:hypothetical protein
MNIETVTISDAPLHCQICKGDEFIVRKNILLNTIWASFLGWEFANRTATCYVCAGCGYIHWFVSSDKLPQQPSDTLQQPSDTLKSDTPTNLLQFKKQIRTKAPRGPGDAI